MSMSIISILSCNVHLGFLILSFSATHRILSLLTIQAYSIPSAMRPPTSASTESMKGMPIMPKPRQNIRPPNVEVAKLP